MPEYFNHDVEPGLLKDDRDELGRQRFYSLAQLAKAFGRSPRTIRWWEQTGRLKTFSIGRSKYVCEAEIQRLIAGAEG